MTKNIDKSTKKMLNGFVVAKRFPISNVVPKTVKK